MEKNDQKNFPRPANPFHILSNGVSNDHPYEEAEEDKDISLKVKGPMEVRWSPYVDNGGSCAALAGKQVPIHHASSQNGDSFPRNPVFPGFVVHLFLEGLKNSSEGAENNESCSWPHLGFTS